jgi:isopenicillin N synthase-like dioxygenase
VSSEISLDLLRSVGSEEFPVIDLADYLRAARGALEQTARQLRHALENIGFLIVVNHRIDAALLAGVVEQARRFHTLPLTDKAKLETRRGASSGFTGYLPSGQYAIKTSELNHNDKPDLNAAFFMDRERSPYDREVSSASFFECRTNGRQICPDFVNS